MLLAIARERKPQGFDFTMKSMKAMKDKDLEEDRPLSFFMNFMLFMVNSEHMPKQGTWSRNSHAWPQIRWHSIFSSPSALAIWTAVIFDRRYRNDETGRRAYDPKVLLKIVLYGYSKGLLSSQDLEEACKKNGRTSLSRGRAVREEHPAHQGRD